MTLRHWRFLDSNFLRELPERFGDLKALEDRTAELRFTGSPDMQSLNWRLSWPPEFLPKMLHLIRSFISLTTTYPRSQPLDQKVAIRLFARLSTKRLLSKGRLSWIWIQVVLCTEVEMRTSPNDLPMFHQESFGKLSNLQEPLGMWKRQGSAAGRSA